MTEVNHSRVSVRFKQYAADGFTHGLTAEDVALFDLLTADTEWVGVGDNSDHGMCQATGDWGPLFWVVTEDEISTGY